MVRSATTTAEVRAVRGGTGHNRPDQIVTEAPLEIRLSGPGQDPSPVAVTMRTPGEDLDLAVGWCVSEGHLRGGAGLASVSHGDDCRGGRDENVVVVALREPVRIGARAVAAMSASCGVCGKSSRDEIPSVPTVSTAGPPTAMATILALPETLRDAQPLFASTGGIHAAARFAPDGTLLAVREDIGRHNALDKLIGDAARTDRLPLREEIILVSGRVSFEIVQKAAMAGAPIVVAVSAPSSLAVETAAAAGQTLVAFVRNGDGNVYTHPERIIGGGS